MKYTFNIKLGVEGVLWAYLNVEIRHENNNWSSNAISL